MVSITVLESLFSIYYYIITQIPEWHLFQHFFEIFSQLSNTVHFSIVTCNNEFFHLKGRKTRPIMYIVTSNVG